ncbi:MAG: Rieske 2Fe-2S domain-containing protein [Egibacteraceae bacterium]
MLLTNVVHRIGQLKALDKPAAFVAENARPFTDLKPVKNALSGTWIGHRLHPLLTDVVIGTWLSAGLLDALGGRQARQSAELLVRSGLLAVVPTATSGLSDYTDLYDHGRRVAFVHVLLTDAAAALQFASVRARRRGDYTKGVALSAAALGVLTGGSYLGGHLSFVLGVGVDHTAFDEGPEEWTDVASDAEIGESPLVVTAGEHEVLVHRVEGRLVGLANRCSHAGWPLEEGEVADGCITCPYHGSVFRLSDGGVVRGPAASPQLRYDVRERAGRVEVRGSR